MKNKKRKIVTPLGDRYYIIKNNVDGDGSNRITILNGSTPIYNKIISGGIVITPKLVSELIKNPG